MKSITLFRFLSKKPCKENTKNKNNNPTSSLDVLSSFMNLLLWKIFYPTSYFSIFIPYVITQKNKYLIYISCIFNHNTSYDITTINYLFYSTHLTYSIYYPLMIILYTAKNLIKTSYFFYLTLFEIIVKNKYLIHTFYYSILRLVIK